MLELPVCRATTFVLVRPHYPENVGAVARAIKTMGMTRLALVRPGRLAIPEHEMAQKMAVKSRDVLARAQRFDTLDEAVAGTQLVFSTSSRRGVSGIVSPRRAAALALAEAARGGRIAVVLGNEKTGLGAEDLARGDAPIRIPMAADQPSVNLAQSAQLIAYEWFVAGLAARNADGDLPNEV